MKFTNCLKCGKKVSKNCHTGYCNTCRDRSGKSNPFFGKKHNREMIENTKIKLSEISKNKWKNEEYRDKVIKGVSKPRREGFKKEQSDRVKEWYRQNPTQKQIRSIAMKKSWKDGKIEPNINSINESKLEREFRAELKKELPNRNVRKETIKIDNRWFYPDIRIDDDIIVEFYGNYWHASSRIFEPDDIVHHNITAKQIWETDRRRIDTLRENGFWVYVIWQHIYEDNKYFTIKSLIEKL
jgi:G:T-mismatch repair DNA endonuclease (very short patch repair protein)